MINTDEVRFKGVDVCTCTCYIATPLNTAVTILVNGVTLKHGDVLTLYTSDRSAIHNLDPDMTLF